MSSISKITNRMAIIKNWFENLKFFSVSELNPHSTFNEEWKLDLNFCFIINMLIVKKIVIMLEIIIWVFGIISDW